jgi:hypothetical protein
MEDLKYVLNNDLLRLTELKNELIELEKKIDKQKQEKKQEEEQQEKLMENLEDIRREKDRLYLFVNHTINLINIEKIKQNKKRRLYVFNCFMFEPIGLFFPDHEEIVYIINEIEQRRDTEEEEQKRIKILSQYYGDYIDKPAPTIEEQKEINRFERENPQHRRPYKQWPQYEFKQGHQTNIFIILKKTEDLRIVIKENKGDAFLCNSYFNTLLLNLLHKNILNVYVSCSSFISVIQEIEFRPIKEKFRMIRADCLGSRQDCEVCAPPAVISYYQQYSALLKQKEL